MIFLENIYNKKAGEIFAGLFIMVLLQISWEKRGQGFNDSRVQVIDFLRRGFP